MFKMFLLHIFKVNIKPKICQTVECHKIKVIFVAEQCTLRQKKTVFVHYSIFVYAVVCVNQSSALRGDSRLGYGLDIY